MASPPLTELRYFAKLTLGVIIVAEFCRVCFLRHNPDISPYKIILSRDLDICEGCGELKRVVEEIRYRTPIDDIIDAIIDRKLKRNRSMD